MVWGFVVEGLMFSGLCGEDVRSLLVLMCIILDRLNEL